MLTIRMQRTGRKGHAQFRVIVQDSRFSPDSGRVVAQLGSYNPHTKATILDKEKAQGYLNNGAQPSDRVVALLKKEGLKLPDWVSESAPKSRAIRNQDKLRRNRPAEPATPEAPVEELASAEQAESAAPTDTEAPAAAELEAETPAEEAAPAAEEIAETDAEAPAEPAQPAE